MYAKNRVGQYSKFLNKNPIFVTYYSINEAETVVDAGTGSVSSELGENSPLRFNKVIDFPIYNIPADLRAEIEWNDDGPDHTLDLDNIAILPNTLKPKPNDYMLLQLPESPQLLFRVNQVEFNTIQSNDFYNISLDLKYNSTSSIPDVEDYYLKNLIVETYDTVFENIGTQDKCFIRLEDESKLNDAKNLLSTLKECYLDGFFYSPVNAFILHDNEEYPDTWFYDCYLSHFISLSEIYKNPDSEKTLVLSLEDNVPFDFEYRFKRTLWYALLTQGTKFLNPYNYFYQGDISKQYSEFKINDISCKSCNVEIMDHDLFAQYTNKLDIPASLQYWNEYFPVSLATNIINNQLPTDYLDQVIYHFMLQDNTIIDSAKIIPYTFEHTMRMYEYMPAIIYILQVFCKSYFQKLE
jgi:hypothetical protein